MKSVSLNRFLLRIILFISLAYSVKVYGQTKQIDSLELILKSQQINRDTIRGNSLYNIAFEYFLVGSEKSIRYLKEAKDISDSLNYTLGKAKVSYLNGVLESQKARYEQSLVFFNQSLEHYTAIKNKKGIASIHTAFGLTHFNQGNFDEASKEYHKAFDIYSEINDEKNLSILAMNLANLASRQGKYDEAFEKYNFLMSKYRESNNEAGLASVRQNMALVLRLQGNYPLAIDYFNKVLEFRQRMMDTLRMSVIYNAIGDTYRSYGKFNLAKKYHLYSIRLDKLKGNIVGISTNYNNLGNVYSALDQVDSAIYYFNVSLDLAKRVKSQVSGILSLLNLGSEYLRLEKYDLALSYYSEALRFSDSIQYPRGIGCSKLGIAQIYVEQGNLMEAYKLAKEGKAIAKKLGLLDVQKSILEVLRKVYQEQGDFEKALYVYQEYKILSDSLINKEKIEKVAQIEYEYLYQHQLDSAKIRELRLTKTVSDTNKNLEKSKRNFLWAVISILAIVLVGAIVIFALRLRNLNTKSQNIITEQKLLRSQMTPHFIFNSLSVLQGMILNNEDDKSINYLSKFSRLLRITLENSRDKMVPLNQELLAIKNYLELQNLEDKNYLYKIEVDEVLSNTELKIPPMLIQPFIENSIEHAFVNHTGEKEIEVHLQLKNDELICSIADNGIGINHSEKKVNHSKKSLSTTITSERLRMMSKHFNKSASVEVEDREQFDEKGTLVTLVIPYLKGTLVNE